MSCPLQPFNLMASRTDGHPVIRFPQQLRLHAALNELGLSSVDDLNDTALLKDYAMPEPILITTNGTILAGFGRWCSAVFNGQQEISCIEYSFSEDESLQFIIKHHQPQRGWNAFIRIRLALKLEPYFQQRALDNMRAGGKYKGSANLPEAPHVDVREDVARVAGVGSRNVSAVKTILKTAHQRLIDALTDGTLRIHRALKWCGLSKAKQLEQFTRYIWERTRNKVIRETVIGAKQGNLGLDPLTVLDALRQQEEERAGSVTVRLSRLRSTVILIGEDLLTDLHTQRSVAAV